MAGMLLCVVTPTGVGQFGTPQVRSVPQVPNQQDMEDPWHTREMQEKLQRAREKDRQKRMVDAANRLVELTAQYRKQVGAHGEATAEDQKLLFEIEKLARDVKDRMKGN